MRRPGPDATRPSPHLTIRTKFLDDGILAAVTEKNSGLSQAVILAAGMDTRAFRLEWPFGLTLFEVDRDEISDSKEVIFARGVDDPQALLARYGWQATVASPGDPEVSYGRWPFPAVPRGTPGTPRSFFVKAVRTND